MLLYCFHEHTSLVLFCIMTPCVCVFTVSECRTCRGQGSDPSNEERHSSRPERGAGPRQVQDTQTDPTGKHEAARRHVRGHVGQRPYARMRKVKGRPDLDISTRHCLVSGALLPRDGSDVIDTVKKFYFVKIAVIEQAWNVSLDRCARSPRVTGMCSPLPRSLTSYKDIK